MTAARAPCRPFNRCRSFATAGATGTDQGTLLFTELLLIRWIPSTVKYVGFFTNFLLMASFLGIGWASCSVGPVEGCQSRRSPGCCSASCCWS